jgi:hypothetical protein
MELGAAAQTKKPTSVILMTKPDDKSLQEKFDSLSTKLFEGNPYL